MPLSEMIIERIKYGVSIDDVDLTDCGITDDDIEELLLLLDGYTITGLCLDANKLTNKSVPCFFKLPSYIQYISICHNLLDDGCAKELMTTFQGIKKLDLDGNNFTDNSCNELFELSQRIELSVRNMSLDWYLVFSIEENSKATRVKKNLQQILPRLYKNQDIVTRISEHVFQKTGGKISIGVSAYPEDNSDRDEIHFFTEHQQEKWCLFDEAEISIVIRNILEAEDEYDKPYIWHHSTHMFRKETLQKSYRDMTLFSLENFEQIQDFLLKNYRGFLEKQFDEQKKIRQQQKPYILAKKGLFTNVNFFWNTSEVPQKRPAGEYDEKKEKKCKIESFF